MAFTEVVDSNNSPVVGEYVTNGTQTVMDGGVTSGGSISGAEGSAAIIVSSGGKVYDLQVNGPNTMIYLRGGELINAQIENLDPAWYTGDGVFAHMQFSAGVIENCYFKYGMLTTVGDNGQIVKNCILSGDEMVNNQGLHYTNFRMGAGVMSNCTVTGYGNLLFGYGNVDGHNFSPVAYNTIVTGNGNVDLRENAILYDTYMNGGKITAAGKCSGTVIDNGTLNVVTTGSIYDTVMNGGTLMVSKTEGVAIDGATLKGGIFQLGASGCIIKNVTAENTKLVGNNADAYLMVANLNAFENVTWNGYDLNETSAAISNGSLLNNADAKTLKFLIVDDSTFIMYADGLVENITIKGESGWIQTTNGTLNNVTIENGRLEAMGTTKVNKVSIVGKGYQEAWHDGSTLVAFGSSVIDDVEIAAGGSAHVYETSQVSNITVKDGGVLRMEGWSTDKVYSGTVDGVTVEAGGKMVFGHYDTTSGTATIKNTTIEEGGMLQITGHDFSLENFVINYGGSEYLVTVDAENKTIDGLVLAEGSIYNGFGENDTHGLTNVVVIEGGSINDMNLNSTVSGEFFFADGSSQTLDISGGEVKSFVVANGAVLYGSADGTMNNVTILDGGSLAGLTMSTNLTGKYVYADGSQLEFYIQDGAEGREAKNLVFNGTAFSLDSGKAENITMNGATLIASNASATGVILANGASLMINDVAGVSLEGINKDYSETSDNYNFSVSSTEASNVVLANGAIFKMGNNYSFAGGVVTGSRAAAENGYSQEDFDVYGGASVLQVNEGGKVDGTVFENGGILEVNGANTSISNIVVGEDAVLRLNLASTGNINGTIYGFVDDEENAGRNLTFDGKKITNVRLVGNNSSLTLGSGMTAENVEMIGMNKNVITGDSSNTITNLYLDVEGTVDAFEANIKNLILVDGEFQARAKVDGAVVSGDAVLSTSLGNAVFNDITLKDSATLTIGSVINQWSNTAYAATVTNIVTEDGFTGKIALRNGVINGLNMNGGTLELDSTAEAAPDRTGINLDFKGNYYFQNTTINDNYGNGITFDDASTTSVIFGAGNKINAEVNYTANDATIIFNGEGNNITKQISATNVVFDLTNMAKCPSLLVSDLSMISASMRGEYIIDAEWRQGYYNLGKAEKFNVGMRFDVDGTTVNDYFRAGQSYTQDGYTATLEKINNYLVLAIKADASTNTKFSWKNNTDPAPYYVNDITETSGTVYLGNTMETEANGHAFKSVGGKISAAGIITSSMNNMTFFGGSNTNDRAASWIKVTGGSNNVIYGGGDGKNMTDGTNIWISASNNAKVYGGSNNANVTGDINVDIDAGSYITVFGGNNNGGTVTGNINVNVAEAQINSHFAGGGIGSVVGNITSEISVNKVSAGNIFGGAIGDASIAGGNVDGNIALTINSGSYQGLVFGGSRISGDASATVTGSITLNVNNITHQDNDAILEEGPTSWIVGGGQAVEGGKLTAGAVSISIADSSIGRVVGGAQADGEGSVAEVGDVEISIDNSSVVNIFGGGYAYNNGASTVNGDTYIVINAGDRTTITGNIYGGGDNPASGVYGGSATVSGDSTIEFSGNGDSLIFTGVVNGDGMIAGTVAGDKNLVFKGFSGTFNGTAVNFDNVSFSGDTAMNMANSFSVSSMTFDLSERSSSMANDGFVSDAASFNFTDGEKNINLIFDFDSDSFDFALMDVSDESLEGATVNIFDINSDQTVSLTFGSQFAIDGKGVFNLDVDDNGMLTASFKKGALA